VRRSARGAAIALCAAALALSCGTAGAAAVVPDGGFVIHGSVTSVQRQVDIAHDAGVRWVSLNTGWETLEPVPDGYLTPGGPGTAAWDELGQKLSYAASRGMGIELRFSNAPAWASGREASNDPPTPANRAAYGEFLADVARRFGAEIDAYSPWNEPNISVFWSPVDPVAYTALQKVAYTAIKAADPTATVLSAPIVGRYGGANSGYAFLRSAYKAGLRGHADVIGWNGYPGGEPESPAPFQGGLPAANTLPAQLTLRDLIDEFDPGRKVWIMELGWSTCAACDASAANGVTEAQQADYLTRAFTYRRRYLTGVTERIFWYQLADEGTTRSVWSQNQGVLRADLTAKPALAAFRALAVQVADPVPGAPPPGSPASPVLVPVPTLPNAAARLGLPVTAASPTGRAKLGRLRLSARRGVFTLRTAVALRGGTSRMRVEGYRARRWRPVATVKLRRSSTVALRIPDRGYVGFRVRLTVPGRTGFRVGRVIRVPLSILRAR